MTDNLKNNFRPKSYKIKNGTWTVFHGLCKGCGLCRAVCPFGAIEFDKENLGIYSNPSAKVIPQKCRACHLCEQICPDCAIKIEDKQKKEMKN